MKRRKLDEIDLFKLWLVERGGELLTTTNEYEVVRFRGDGITSIIYTNNKGRRSFTGRAQAALDAFRDRSPSFRFGKTLPLVGTTKHQHRKSVVVQTLIERDGDICFYCGDPFSEERPRTKEHLVARTHSGPDHISNLFLSCVGCNQEAGHLSAPEKLRMRDRKRRGRGSRLLAKVLEANGSYSGELIDEIMRFLHDSKPEQPQKEKTA